MKKSFKDSAPLWALFSLPVLYFAVVAASVYEEGMTLFQLMPLLTDAKLVSVQWTAYTPKFILIFLAVYAGAIVLYYSAQQNRRPGEEHGSAKWGSVRELNKKYSDKDPKQNAILTKHLSMSLNGRQHLRNLLQIVVGGSGAGKTRYVVKPNLMLANASFIATDPKGELVRAVAPLLLQQGYVVKVFDLIDPAHSDSYNPFRYIRKDSDVFRLINNFIQNTTPKGAHESDPFWTKSETALDAALMLYLLHEAPPEEQTMEMMLTMIEYGAVKEDDDDYQSPLDLLFEALEEEQPGHIALRQYRIFKQAAGKTAKSILVSAAVRLAAFTLPEIQSITGEDSLELARLGERKQAVFCVIPDSNDNSLNFLVGMLYTQAFQELYYQADKIHQGPLPIPVRLMFDEFANVALPDGYARLQATMRSRNIKETDRHLDSPGAVCLPVHGSGLRHRGRPPYHCEQPFGLYLLLHQGHRHHHPGLGRGAGGHEHPEPRRQPALPGLPLPLRRPGHRLCQGNPDRHRRDVKMRLTVRRNSTVKRIYFMDLYFRRTEP